MHDVVRYRRRDMFGGAILELDQHAHAGGALHQRGDGAGAALPDDQVSLPVARHGSVFDLRGAFGDVDHPQDCASSKGGSRARTSPSPARAQARGELLSQLALRLDEDRLVDGLVRHPPLWLVGVLLVEPVGDLLGRPLLGAQQSLDLLPQPGAFFGPGVLGPSGNSSRSLFGGRCSVAPPPTVGRDLTPDRRAMPADARGDGFVGRSGLDADPDLLALGHTQRAGAPFAFVCHGPTLVAQIRSEGGYLHPVKNPLRAAPGNAPSHETPSQDVNPYRRLRNPGQRLGTPIARSGEHRLDRHVEIRLTRAALPSSGFHLTPPGREMSRSPLEPKATRILRGSPSGPVTRIRCNPSDTEEDTGTHGPEYGWLRLLEASCQKSTG